MHRIVALALFTIIMVAVGWLLKLVVPDLGAWLGGNFGEAGSLLVVLAVAATCLIIGLWPRDEAGRMRPLLPRRR